MRVRIVGLLLTVLAVLVSSAHASEVVTIAGNGDDFEQSTTETATDVGVGGPFGVVIGPDEALYICETTGHVVRRWDPKTKRLTIVAGTGRKGYSGDGGPATKATLNEPYEVRFDADGNMFFVEMQNHIVRRVDAETGIISTVAGSGRKGFSGDGGKATEAELHRPHSIVLDKKGHLYICDIGNHRIRRVDLKTGHIMTYAGTGKKGNTPDGAPLAGTPLSGPRALDIGPDGILYLALREGNAVFAIDPETATLKHLAGTGKSGYTGDGGPAKVAKLSGPKGIAVGPEGDLYLADTESHTIRVIRMASGTIETLVGNGNPGDGPDGDPRKCRTKRPHGVYVDRAGQVYIGDSSNNKVRVFRPNANSK
ncbi:NHL domain-containing protein [Thalassoroseus pseudoceratinae]|uniref:NHL domain-containing protein n=1 Tax=Thalassoroseus pseudoceratinae TaxID=2713176 RepID=UPI001421F8A6|nr:hypothetical protein [Thalassoroseus pseudoceratinae]